MRIAVLIKQVPDSDEIKMDPDKGTMIREGSGNIVNPLDLNALQAALDVKKNAERISLLFRWGLNRRILL